MEYKVVLTNDFISITQEKILQNRPNLAPIFLKTSAILKNRRRFFSLGHFFKNVNILIIGAGNFFSKNVDVVVFQNYRRREFGVIFDDFFSKSSRRSFYKNTIVPPWKFFKNVNNEINGTDIVFSKNNVVVVFESIDRRKYSNVR